MFGSYRKHQQWIWILGVIVIVPSFVVYFDPSVRWSGSGRGGAGEGEHGSINGRRISSSEYNSAMREAAVLLYLYSGGWKKVEDNPLQDQTRRQLLMTEEIKELDIHVSDTAVARVAALVASQLSGGNYDQLVRTLLLEAPARYGLKSEDVERALRHEAAKQQLVFVAGVTSQLVPPRHAEALFRKGHEEALMDVVMFSATNYLKEVAVTPTDISAYYASRSNFYRLPERLKLSYVAFARSNFLAEVDKDLAQNTNLTANIDRFYRERGAENFKDTNGVVLSEKDAKAKVREEGRQQAAEAKAERKANELGSALFDLKSRTVEEFERVATAQGAAVKVTAPFDLNEGPAEFDLLAELGSKFRRDVFSLTNKTEAILIAPVPGADAVYVVAVQGRLPSEAQAFEKIQDKVTADYKRGKARELAVKAGTAFSLAVTNGLAQKKTFAALCNEAQLKPVSLPPISVSTRETDVLLPEGLSLRTIVSVAPDLSTGQASPFRYTAEGGFVLYVRARPPLDEAKLKTEFPLFLASLRQSRVNDAVNGWFNIHGPRYQPGRQDQPRAGGAPATEPEN